MTTVANLSDHRPPWWVPGGECSVCGQDVPIASRQIRDGEPYRRCYDCLAAEYAQGRPRWLNAVLTTDNERVIREAHAAMDARSRGKSGVHTATDACRVIRSLLDVLADLTGITSATDTLI